MNESDFVALLEEARVDLGPPPVDAILREAKDSARRRRRRAVTGLAAAALLVAGLGATSLGGQPEDDPDQPDVIRPTGPLVPPAGMRYVGFDDFAIAVPASWATNEFGCQWVSRGERAFVVFSGGQGSGDCLARPAPMLGIDDAPHWPDRDQPWDQREVAGVPVAVSGPTPTVGGFLDLQVGIPDTDNLLTIRTRSLQDGSASKLAEDMLATLTRLPAGQVAVPAAYGLDRVNLRVRVTRRVSSEFRYDYVLDQSPPQGSVVPIGSTVHVVLAGRITDPVSPQSWEAAGFHLRDPGGSTGSTLSADEALTRAGINAPATQAVLVRLTVDGRRDIRNRLVYVLVHRVWKPDLSSSEVADWSIVARVVDARTGIEVLSRTL